MEEALKILAQDGTQKQYTSDKLAMVIWFHYALGRAPSHWQGLELPLAMPDVRVLTSQSESIRHQLPNEVDVSRNSGLEFEAVVADARPA